MMHNDHHDDHDDGSKHETEEDVIRMNDDGTIKGEEFLSFKVQRMLHLLAVLFRET